MIVVQNERSPTMFQLVKIISKVHDLDVVVVDDPALLSHRAIRQRSGLGHSSNGVYQQSGCERRNGCLLYTKMTKS